MKLGVRLQCVLLWKGFRISDWKGKVIFKGPMKKLWVLYQLFGDHEELRDLMLGFPPKIISFIFVPCLLNLNNHKKQELEVSSSRGRWQRSRGPYFNHSPEFS